MNQALTLLAAVDELASVDSLSCNEQLSPLLEPVWVTENHLCQGSPTARVVNDVLESREGSNMSEHVKTPVKYITTWSLTHLHDSLDVAMAFSEVNVPEFGWSFPVLDMGFEDGARTFSLTPDHTSHFGLVENISVPVRSNINLAACATSILTVKMHHFF